MRPNPTPGPPWLADRRLAHPDSRRGGECGFRGRSRNLEIDPPQLATTWLCKAVRFQELVRLMVDHDRERRQTEEHYV